MWFLENAWLIPVIPAVSFALILLVGKRMPAKGSELGVTAVLTSLVLSFGAAFQWISRVNDAEDGAEHGVEEGGEHALGILNAVGRGLVRAQEEVHHEVVEVLPVIKQWTWWQSGGHEFHIGTHIDGLAVALLVVVTIISSLVHIFSLEYMRGDRRYTHYYAALSLFTCGMLTLVVAENTLQLLLGWEIMGLCSFMLIGHWWEEYPNARAALKAFFTTRTGDTGLLVGIAILYFAAGSFSIAEISEAALSGEVSHLVLLMASISLFIAVIGKSGQFPLHTWLPDAMAGPTPVSALIHAATMVVAGVYLVARLYPVFWEGFSIADGGMNFMAIIGGITIIIAALLAFVQVDIKKVLAYSTVSQLGYMVMGLGVGAWTAAVFHIFTHAFFKALLFLAAGSISHSGSHHSFDMKAAMGGLRKHMPITFATFVVGTLALAGIFPLAGFWSKDEILANAGHNGYTAFMVVGLVGAFLTAAYMTRCVWLTFFGEYRGGHASDVVHDDVVQAEALELEDDPRHDPQEVLTGIGATRATVSDVGHDAGGIVHATTAGHDAHTVHDDHGAHEGPHESPWLLTVPLVILAVLALTSGFLNAVAFDIEKFQEWVEPRFAFPEVDHAPFKWSEAGLSLGIAVAGIAIAGALMARDLGRFKNLTARSRPARAGYSFLWNKYYLDHLYEKVVVAGIAGPIARAANWINQKVLDGIVNAAGVGTRETGRFVYRKVDQLGVDGVVNGTGLAAGGTGSVLRLLQSGKVQQYGALLFGAATAGALILVIVV